MDFREVIEFFKDAIKYIIAAVLVFLLFIFVVGLQQVVGPSMSPTLKEGSVVVVNKMKKNFKREDVIILSEGEKYMVKRVIGLPGEYIEYKDNTLYINGKKYKEDYLNDNVVTEDFKLEDIGETVIPEGKYFVLGDNRTNSSDSREYGLVSKDKIIGKVMFSIWPVNKIKIF